MFSGKEEFEKVCCIIVATMVKVKVPTCHQSPKDEKRVKRRERSVKSRGKRRQPLSFFRGNGNKETRRVDKLVCGLREEEVESAAWVADRGEDPSPPMKRKGLSKEEKGFMTGSFEAKYLKSEGLEQRTKSVTTRETGAEEIVDTEMVSLTTEVVSPPVGEEGVMRSEKGIVFYERGDVTVGRACYPVRVGLVNYLTTGMTRVISSKAS